MVYNIIDTSRLSIQSIAIRSDDLCKDGAGEKCTENEIVVLHIKTDTDVTIVHDDYPSTHQIKIPIDCIDALIAALYELKEIDLELSNQRKYKKEKCLHFDSGVCCKDAETCDSLCNNHPNLGA